MNVEGFKNSSSNNEMFKEYSTKFSEVAHKLLAIQNELFKIQYEFHGKIDDIQKIFDSQTFAKIIEHSKSVQHDEEFSVWNIYNIKKKHPKVEDLDTIALSDDNMTFKDQDCSK